MGSEMVVRELRHILLLALPAIVTTCSTMGVTATDQIMVGSLGRSELAAASIGNTWFNLMFYFQVGFSTALDTKASQAYGAQDFSSIRQSLCVALILGALTTIPMQVGLLYAEVVSEYLFQQPSDIAEQVAAFCYRLIPGVIPQILGLLLIKVLQAQNEMLAPAILSIAVFLINIPMNLIFIRWFGFVGAPLATTVTRFCFLTGATLLLLLSLQRRKHSSTAPGIYISASSERYQSESSKMGSESLQERKLCELSQSGCCAQAKSSGVISQIVEKELQCNQKISVFPELHSGDRDKLIITQSTSSQHYNGDVSSWRNAWQNAMTARVMWEYLQLAIPGGFMVALEAGSFDVSTVMVAALGVSQVDAHFAMMTVNTFNFMSFPFGIGIAATIRVGNLLGAGLPSQAAVAGWAAVALGGISMALCGGVTVIFRSQIGYIFIDDPAVVALVATIAPFAALLQFFDGLMGTSQGALRGVGKQAQILLFNLLGFWAIGVSTGALLRYEAGWGLNGVWIGLMLGVACTAILNLIGLTLVNWSKSAAITSLEIDGVELTHGNLTDENGSQALDTQALLSPCDPSATVDSLEIEACRES